MKGQIVGGVIVFRGLVWTIVAVLCLPGVCVGQTSGCPGDADRNGFVNGTDFSTVRNHFGESTCGEGDADGNCFVNADDYRSVRDHFGLPCPATPTPTTSRPTDTSTPTVTATSGPCVYTQSGDQIVIEAEHYAANLTRSGHTWNLYTSLPGASGGQYLVCEPDNGTNLSDLSSSYAALAPQLDYFINNTTTGTWYVWVRGNGADFDANSCHIGLDGMAPTTGEIVETFEPDNTWVWVGSTRNYGRARLEISTAGQHTLNVWMREDGCRIDKILLTTDVNYTPPADTGPAESGCRGGSSATSTPTPASGDPFGEMIFIAGGRAAFGADPSLYPNDVYRDELPEQSIANVNGFYLARNEVTNRLFCDFLNAVGTNQDAFGHQYLDLDDPQVQITYSGGVYQPRTGMAEYPVVEVTWYGATAFCAWGGGRLPTEVEWEKAAGWNPQTQAHSMWPWGGRSVPPSNNDPAFCARNSSWWCNDPDSTRPVGSYPTGASYYGGLDLAGNVWEWTSGYKSHPGSSYPFDWSGDYIVAKGGSWTNSDYNLRTWGRCPQPKYISDANLGFRPARDVPWSGWSAPAPAEAPGTQQPKVATVWQYDFNSAVNVAQTYDWWGTGRSWSTDTANGWFVAALEGNPWPAGEYAALTRFDLSGTFSVGQTVNISVRVKSDRAQRDYVRTSVAFAWGNTISIVPGWRGADENWGHPWRLLANNTDQSDTWEVVTQTGVVVEPGKLSIAFGLWGNLTERIGLANAHRMYVDWIRVEAAN